MAGVKMGDRVLQLGCTSGGRLAAIAAKVGLSGRAAAIVDTQAAAARARKAAAQAGVLIEIEIGSEGALPFEEGSFDLVVLDGTRDRIARMTPEERVTMSREAMRVLRTGGRVFAIEDAPRGGLAGALFDRRRADSRYEHSGGAAALLGAEGLRAVRVLAEREGLRFTEAVKTR